MTLNINNTLGSEDLLRNFAETAMSWAGIIDDFRGTFSEESAADEDDS